MFTVAQSSIRKKSSLFVNNFQCKVVLLILHVWNRVSSLYFIQYFLTFIYHLVQCWVIRNKNANMTNTDKSSLLFNSIVWLHEMDFTAVIHCLELLKFTNIFIKLVSRAFVVYFVRLRMKYNYHTNMNILNHISIVFL